ncbi:MAG: cysteine-rich repeat protein [Candidatus Binatia bacterium]|jgi:cysteine-rich repeat protein
MTVIRRNDSTRHLGLGRAAFGLGAVAVASMVLSVSDASALTGKEIRCRDKVSRYTREVVFRTTQARLGCVRRKAHGEVDPSVDCTAEPEELGGPGTGDLRTDRRLARAALQGERAGSVLVGRCDSLDRDGMPKADDIDPVDLELDDLCGGSTDDWREVGVCAVELGRAASLVFMDIFDLDVSGDSLPASHLDCLKHFARQSRTVVGVTHRFRSQCFVKDDLAADGGGVLACGASVMPFGTIGSTGDSKIDKRLGQPYPKADDILRRKCDLPIDELGFETIIPDLTGGRFAGRVTLDDVIHAFNDAVQTATYQVAFGATGTEGLFPVAARGGFCGDGSVDAGETCDDGNNISCDGCDRDCTDSSICGNGAVCNAFGADEECDDGNVVSGDGCSATCISELCLNGVLNPGYDEECDDGAESFDCDLDCTLAFCGDGQNNLTRGEVCDTGVGVPTDTPVCDSDCTAPFCQDGHLNLTSPNVPASNLSGLEECDDGGESVACDTNCTFASCGDGDTNLARGEECDDFDSTDNDFCVSSATQQGTNCQLARCGDGFLCTGISCSSGPSGAAEDCDDGLSPEGDAESATCNSDCSVDACADGNLNPQSGEECDAGAGLTTNAHPCTGTCQIAYCGDTNVCNAVGCTTGPGAALEECDDGDGNNNDACKSNCQDATCGDSVLCTEAGCNTAGLGPEECDEGGESADCDSNCTGAVCGDSTVNATAGETCDTGGDSLTCDSDCSSNLCLDGYLNETNEECDDGNLDQNDPCLVTCVIASCGDSVTCSDAACATGPGGGVEACDDGGESLACDLDCSAASCGDGQINATRGEECDASGAETTTCDTDCSAAFCGDGTPNATAGEQCDDGDDNNDDSCTDDVTGGGSCQNATCGDGFLCSDGGCNTAGVGVETCDDGDDDVNDTCPDGATGTGNCLVATCGDGFLCTDGACNTAGLGVEICDDSNASANDLCPTGGSGTCQVASCGDGVVCSDGACTTGPGGGVETCDDGNANSNDLCPDGFGGTCGAAFCGDSVICNDGCAGSTEVCDDGALNGSGSGACLGDCSGIAP